jgi:hypothetical protein
MRRSSEWSLSVRSAPTNTLYACYQRIISSPRHFEFVCFYANPPNWRTTHYRLSGTAYSLYLQLVCILGDRFFFSNFIFYSVCNITNMIGEFALRVSVISCNLILHGQQETDCLTRVYRKLSGTCIQETDYIHLYTGVYLARVYRRLS